MVLSRDVIQTKKTRMLEAGEPIGKEKFEKVTVTVKSFEKYALFEKVLDAQNVAKDSEAYYLMLSEYRIVLA